MCFRYNSHGSGESGVGLGWIMCNFTDFRHGLSTRLQRALELGSTLEGHLARGLCGGRVEWPGLRLHLRPNILPWEPMGRGCLPTYSVLCVR